MKEDLREKIACRLRELRANKKYTLKEVSSISGVSKDIVWRYENNIVSMQVDHLKKILEVYGSNLSDFFKEILAKTQ